MNNSNNIYVYIQTVNNSIHPISRKVIKTAEVLGNESKKDVIGIFFVDKVTEELRKNLVNTNLTKIIIYSNKVFGTFVPENEVLYISKNVKDADVFLVPSTPEGRTISSMAAAKLKTGCTADCTSLEFDQDGYLIQTRPAFSGNVMASIVTKNTRPQIASLKFAKEGFIEEVEPLLEIVKDIDNISYSDELPVISSKISDFDGDIINIAVVAGNAINSKDELDLCRKFADKIGGKLFTTRALVDKGISDKSLQVGLSGQSISVKTLITLGVSGSVQFLAGIEKVEKIIAINTNENAPIMMKADVPVIMDVNEILRNI